MPRGLRVSSRILRFDDWTDPVPPVARNVVGVLPASGGDAKPPLLFVPGPGHGAWVFAEHWLGHAASRGFPAHALDLRAEGGLRAYAHDVVQVAAGLPRQTVLVGHGAGAVIVEHALARYPARAAVLVSPGLDRWTAMRANPIGTLPALVTRTRPGSARRGCCPGRRRGGRSGIHRRWSPAARTTGWYRVPRWTGRRPGTAVRRCCSRAWGTS
jgi:pimeloyl-ACP methyl ester carboxylesterase